MGKQVRCSVTGEKGDPKQFKKIGGKYYKSFDVYDLYQHNKKYIDESCKIIVNDFLTYDEINPFPSYIYTRMKEFYKYPGEVLLDTVNYVKKNNLRQISDKHFDSTYMKVAYIMAVIRNKIPDIHKQYQEKERIKERKKKTEETGQNIVQLDESVAPDLSLHASDISKFL